MAIPYLLPVGSPSGGVRAGGAAANAAETDVQSRGRRRKRRLIFTFGAAKPFQRNVETESRGEENG